LKRKWYLFVGSFENVFKTLVKFAIGRLLYCEILQSWKNIKEQSITIKLVMKK